MLFNKKIEPCCSYCKSGSAISDTEVICVRRGVMLCSGSCGKFAYDPLKRKPAAPVSLDTSELNAEDFKL